MQSRRRIVFASIIALFVVAIALSIAVATHFGVLVRTDSALARGLNRTVSPHHAWVTFWKAVTDLGSPVVWDVAAACVVGAHCLRRRFRTAAVIAGGVTGAAVLSTVIKAVVGRPRPLVAVPVDHATGMSFPSGHALTSFVAAGLFVALALRSGRPVHRILTVGVAAVVVAAVGFSRLILGVHFLSDVLAAWCIGAVWLGAVLRMLVRGDRPVVEPSGPAPLVPVARTAA